VGEEEEVNYRDNDEEWEIMVWLKWDWNGGWGVVWYDSSQRERGSYLRWYFEGCTKSGRKQPRNHKNGKRRAEGKVIEEIFGLMNERVS